MLIGLLHGVAFANRFVTPALAMPLERDLGLDDAGLAIAIGPALILPYVVGIYMAGRLCRLDSAGRWMAMSLLVCASANVLGAAWPNASIFFLSRGLLGLGEAGFDASALLMLSATPIDSGGRGFGAFTAGSVAGKASALGGAGVLLGAFEAALAPGGRGNDAWRLVMLTFAIAAAAAAFACRMFPPALVRSRLAIPAAPVSPARFPSARLLGFMITAGAGVFISQAFAAFAPLALTRDYGASPAHAAEWLGVLVMLTGVAGSWLGGELAGGRIRRNAEAVLAMPLILAVVAAALLWVSASVHLALAAMALLMISVSTLAPLGLSSVRKAGDAGSSGRVLSGYIAGATLVAFGLGPTSIGVLASRLHGPDAVRTAICSVVMAAGLIGVVSALSTRLGRRPLPA